MAPNLLCDFQILHPAARAERVPACLFTGRRADAALCRCREVTDLPMRTAMRAAARYLAFHAMAPAWHIHGSLLFCV